jgi:hypothetical protein
MNEPDEQLNLKTSRLLHADRIDPLVVLFAGRILSQASFNHLSEAMKPGHGKGNRPTLGSCEHFGIRVRAD